MLTKSFVLGLLLSFTVAQNSFLQRVKRTLFYPLSKELGFKPPEREYDLDRNGQLPLEAHYPHPPSEDDRQGIRNPHEFSFKPHQEAFKPNIFASDQKHKPKLTAQSDKHHPSHEIHEDNPGKFQGSFHKPLHHGPAIKPKPAYEEPIHSSNNHKTIPGEPGVDYPIYHKIPPTSFSCEHVPYRPGMYANPEAACQVYHVCNDDRHGPQGAAFLCTNGTLFNQKTFNCDWWYNVDCSKSKDAYELNLDPDHNPYFKKRDEELLQEAAHPGPPYHGSDSVHKREGSTSHEAPLFTSNHHVAPEPHFHPFETKPQHSKSPSRDNFPEFGLAPFRPQRPYQHGQEPHAPSRKEPHYRPIQEDSYRPSTTEPKAPPRPFSEHKFQPALTEPIANQQPHKPLGPSLLKDKPRITYRRPRPEPRPTFASFSHQTTTKPAASVAGRHPQRPQFTPPSFQEARKKSQARMSPSTAEPTHFGEDDPAQFVWGQKTAKNT